MHNQLNFELVQRAKQILRRARKDLGRDLGGLGMFNLFADQMPTLSSPRISALVKHFGGPAYVGR